MSRVCDRVDDQKATQRQAAIIVCEPLPCLSKTAVGARADVWWRLNLGWVGRRLMQPGTGQIKRPVVNGVGKQHAVRGSAAGGGCHGLELGENRELIAVLVALWSASVGCKTRSN